MRNLCKKLVSKISSYDPDVMFVAGLAIVLALSMFFAIFDVRPMQVNAVVESETEVTNVTESVEVEETVETEVEETEAYISEEPVETELVVVEHIETEVVETEQVEPAVTEHVETEPVTTYYDVPLSQDLQDYIFKLCDERGIDPTIVIGIIERESKYDASTIGDNGNSLGLMQIQPRWHQARMTEYNCTNLLNPYENVCIGIDILADLIDSGNSLEWALMAYNGGSGYAYDKVSRGEVSDYAYTVLHISKNLKG